MYSTMVQLGTQVVFASYMYMYILQVWTSSQDQEWDTNNYNYKEVERDRGRVQRREGGKKQEMRDTYMFFYPSSHCLCILSRTFCSVIWTVSESRPAFLMHWIRSHHVNDTGIPVPEYHWLSMAWIKASFPWCESWRLFTSTGFRSSRLAKLAQMVSGCKAIKPEIDWLLSHGWILIRSFHVRLATGMDTSTFCNTWCITWIGMVLQKN